MGDEEATIRSDAEAGSVDAMVRLAQLLSRWGATEEAMAEAEPWFRRAAEAGSTYEMECLALFLSRRGATDEAESWYRRAAEAGSDGAVLYLARFLRARGAKDEAESWYRRVTDDRYAVPAMTGLAQLLHERGAAEDAIAVYRQAFGRDYVAATCSALARVHEWVPDLLARGRFEAAEAVLRELERQEEYMARIEEEYEARIRDEIARTGVVPATGGSSWGTMVMTMVATAAVIPFLQTIMAKAGEDGYGAVRSAIRRMSRREQVQPAEPDGQKNVIIHVPVNVPDEALRRLMSMDLAALMRASNSSAIEVSWDDDQQEWKVVTRG